MTSDGPDAPGWGGPPPNPYLPPGDAEGPYGLPLPTDPAAYAAEHQAQQEAGPRAPGAHRAPASTSSRTGVYVLLGLLGALALLALGLGVKGWLGGSSPTPAAGPTSSQVHVPTGTSPTAVSPSATATPTPTPTASPTHSTTPSPKPTASSKPTTKPKPGPPVVHAPTVVLNETRITGLAARTAAYLRSLGWTVTGVGNWRGEISTSTVYYPPGFLAAARRLAYDLKISRLRPRVPGMLTDELTVVLVRDP